MAHPARNGTAPLCPIVELTSLYNRHSRFLSVIKLLTKRLSFDKIEDVGWLVPPDAHIRL